MEASETFGAGIEAPVDDPFAETSDEEFTQDDPLAGVQDETAVLATTEPVEGMPVVDAEGHEVAISAQPIEAANDVTQVAATAPLGDGRPTAEPEGPTTDDEAALIEAEQARAEDERQADEALAAMERDQPVAQPVAVMVPAQQEAPLPPTQASAPVSSVDAGAPSPASSAAAPTERPAPTQPEEPSGEAEMSPGEPEAANDAEIAPAPKEKSDKKGNVTHRRYVLLTPDGNGKHREVFWYEDKEGKMVEKGTPAARRQSVCIARGQEEALAIGFNALGSPEKGVKLRAVAYAYWGEAKHVAPDPIPPSRQRLKIR